MPDNFLHHSTEFFAFGMTSGIFVAGFLYMLFFALSQAAWYFNRHVVSIFIYAAIATVSFGLFSAYCMPLHFPVMSSVIPQGILAVGKVSAPIGVIAFIKMFMSAVPVKSLHAFLFWHRTKRLYQLLYALSAICIVVFSMIDSRQIIVILTFVLFVVNCGVGIVFAYSALESKVLSKLYAAILGIVCITSAMLICVIASFDLTRLPSALFLGIHLLMSTLMLLFGFVIMRYTLDETMRFESITKVQVEDFYRNIYHAIQHNEFFIEYQPQMNLVTHEVVGIEALIRWQHPIKGCVSPDNFIPAAEQTEIIDHICKWVITTAIEDIKQLRAQDLLLPVSINFSVSNIHPEMMTFLIDTMDKHHVPPAMIMVEITESLFLDMTSAQTQALNMLHQKGIGLSLDDFGAGFSSLRHLDSMGLTEVKIDREFAEKLFDHQKHKVVSAIINLCHALDIQLVAEGVDDPETQRLLGEMGCDLVQGYGICRPKQLHELILWYRSYTQTDAILESPTQ